MTRVSKKITTNKCWLLAALTILSSHLSAEDVWIPGWKNAAPMVIERAGSTAVTHGNKIYVIGGIDGKIFLSSVEVTEVNVDGSLSQWQIISRMPAPRGFASSTIFKNRLYVLGGGNGVYGKNLLRNIVSTPILAGGMLGDWRTESTQLVIPRRCSKLFVHNNSLYTLGGFGGALLDSVEMAGFGSNGELGEWIMLQNKLTRPRYVNSVSTLDDYVFVIGGHHETKGVGISSVEYASLRTSPLEWKTTHALNNGRYAFSSVSFKKELYALGGISGSEYLDSVEKLNIHDDGLKGTTWLESTKLPKKMANFSTVIVDERIYVLGGSTGQTYRSSVWYSGFDARGDIGYWGTKSQRDKTLLPSNKNDLDVKLPNSGNVIDRIETEGYSYMLINNDGRLIWLAAPLNVIKINTRVRYSEGVFMSNFYSKSLNRNFETILFVGTVKVDIKSK